VIFEEKNTVTGRKERRHPNATDLFRTVGYFEPFIPHRE